MILLIAGSRTFNDYDRLKTEINKLTFDGIVSGGAKGADTLARKYAFENKIPFTEIIPDWSSLGKEAGYRRNEQMWEIADYGIIFWDGKSKGTKHNIELAKEQGKRIIIVTDKINEKQPIFMDF